MRERESLMKAKFWKLAVRLTLKEGGVLLQPEGGDPLLVGWERTAIVVWEAFGVPSSEWDQETRAIFRVWCLQQLRYTEAGAEDLAAWWSR